MNFVRADAMDRLIKRLKTIPRVKVRPMIGAIITNGINFQRVEIEDAEILANLPDLDEYMERHARNVADTLLLPRNPQ